LGRRCPGRRIQGGECDLVRLWRLPVPAVTGEGWVLSLGNPFVALEARPSWVIRSCFQGQKTRDTALIGWRWRIGGPKTGTAARRAGGCGVWIRPWRSNGGGGRCSSLCRAGSIRWGGGEGFSRFRGSREMVEGISLARGGERFRQGGHFPRAGPWCPFQNTAGARLVTRDPGWPGPGTPPRH